MTDDEKKAEHVARYQAAAHAMQSGVAYDPDVTSQQPKHLRVGINAALVDHGGLVMLLIKKGLITEEEYFRAIAEAMEGERDRYEADLSKKFGKPITLG